jgi:hypothetical protein
MSTVRLTLTDELEEILRELEQDYRPLTRAELIKLAIAELYRGRQWNQPSTPSLSLEDSLQVLTAYQDAKSSSKSFNNSQDLKKWLKS